MTGCRLYWPENRTKEPLRRYKRPIQQRQESQLIWVDDEDGGYYQVVKEETREPKHNAEGRAAAERKDWQDYCRRMLMIGEWDDEHFLRMMRRGQK